MLRSACLINPSILVMPKSLARVLLVCLFLFSCFMFARAQQQPGPTEREQLYREIFVQDSLLFTAFHARNLDQLQLFFADDLELYQDNVGVRNKKEAMKAFGEMFGQDLTLTRQLVKGSMEVYPIRGFGAIQTGAHMFTHFEDGKEIKGVFKFTHIWQKTAAGWKIKRLITYDH